MASNIIAMKQKTEDGSFVEIHPKTVASAVDGNVGEVASVSTAEIFNDYETNKAYTEHSHAEGTGTIAGKMAHLIMSIPSTNQIELESVEGLAVGYVVSYAVPDKGNVNAWAEKQDMGTITAIEGNVITLNTEITLLTNDHIQEEYAGKPVRDQRIVRRLWINDHPEVGMYSLSMRTHAEGRETKALGDASHTEGRGTITIGAYSHSEGRNTKAYAESSHTEGYNTKTYTDASRSHAEGDGTEVYGYAGHAEGGLTKAIGKYSHAEGQETTADGNSSHSEGVGTSSTNIGSHAEGKSSVASGEGSHAEGVETSAEAFAAHAEGRSAVASGAASHAEGTLTVAGAENSHAEGKNTKANGFTAHAEGFYTVADANYSHAGGNISRATGIGSFAHGYSAFASADYSTALGKFPETDHSKKLVLNIGNGETADTRSSALKLDFDGNLTIQGGITANNIYNKTEVDSKLSSVYKYKGTVSSYDALPINAEIGDVYNVETESEKRISVYSVTVTRVYYNDVLECTNLYMSGVLPSYAGVLYDSTMREIGIVNFNDMDSVYLYGNYSDLQPGQYYIKFNDQTYNTYEVVQLSIKPGDNVAWTGSEWDVLAGTIDTSSFATRSNTLSGYGITDAYTKDEIDMQRMIIDGNNDLVEASVQALQTEINNLKAQIAELTNTIASLNLGLANGYEDMDSQTVAFDYAEEEEF